MRALLICLLMLLLVITAAGIVSCSPSEPSDCTVGAPSWNHAKFHIGETKRIWGPVVGIYIVSDDTGKYTIFSIGDEYPSPRPDAFVVVISDQYRGNFPDPLEEHYLNKTICVNGLVRVSEGLAQMEITSPDQIQIQ